MGEAGSGAQPKGVAPRSIVLCADDYAMNGGVSEGILALAEAGRISATSCMTNAPDWSRYAQALKRFDGRLGIGLHLTLTWGEPLGPMPRFAPGGAFPALEGVMRQALLRRLDRAELQVEIGRQLDVFSTGFGREPDFIDGHQHVQVLPVVREALLAVLVERGLARRLWLRDSSDRVASILARRVAAPKALLVHALAAGFRRAAADAGFATNAGFSGYSAFDPARPVGPDMARYLEALGKKPLVMCHPGLPDASDPDEKIGPAREREYAYLASDAFTALLKQRGLRLANAPT